MRPDETPTEKFQPVLTPSEKSRVAFIDIGRAVAALVVFYTHIANQFVESRHGSTAVTDTFTALFETPLQLSSEGIGQIAIYFFFLVSGFIVTPIALKLGARRFGVNRFFRIYPMNVLAVLLAAGLVALGARVLSAGQKEDIGVGMLLSNASLVNFSTKPFGALVGVAWTLAIEVLFYALLIAVLPLLRRWVWLAIFVELDVVLVLVMLRQPLGPDYGGFASQAAYLLIPIIGQIIWAGWHGKIHPWLAGGYLLAAWGLFVMASNLELDIDYLLRAAPIAFAVLVFFVGLGVEQRLRERWFWTALSERSYSLYLMHGLVALPIMHALSDTLPIWLSVLLGVGATFGLVEATYRLVERPSHNLGRRLSRRPEGPKATKEAEQAREPEPAEPAEPAEPDDEELDVAEEPERAGPREPQRRLPPAREPREPAPRGQAPREFEPREQAPRGPGGGQPPREPQPRGQAPREPRRREQPAAGMPPRRPEPNGRPRPGGPPPVNGHPRVPVRRDAALGQPDFTGRREAPGPWPAQPEQSERRAAPGQWAAQPEPSGRLEQPQRSGQPQRNGRPHPARRPDVNGHRERASHPDDDPPQPRRGRHARP